MDNNQRRTALENKVNSQAAANRAENLSPEKTLVLVVDVMNNSMRDEGAMKAAMNFDISRFKKSEKPMIDFVNRAKSAGVQCCYVQCIYDYKYIQDNMRNEFILTNTPDVMNKKGSWGDQIIDTLPAPDYRLIKCQFSSFTPHSFMFSDRQHPEIGEYLLKTEDKDSEIKANGGKVMEDYFAEAAANAERAACDGLEQCMADGVVLLETFLKNKGIETIIFAGGSTDVCVDASVTAAAERGYTIILPTDLLASEDYDRHLEYLDNMGFFKGKLTVSDNISFQS